MKKILSPIAIIALVFLTSPYVTLAYSLSPSSYSSDSDVISISLDSGQGWSSFNVSGTSVTGGSSDVSESVYDLYGSASPAGDSFHVLILNDLSPGSCWYDSLSYDECVSSHSSEIVHDYLITGSTVLPLPTSAVSVAAIQTIWDTTVGSANTIILDLIPYTLPSVLLLGKL